MIIDTINKLLGAINNTKWSGKNAKAVYITKNYEKGKKVDKDVLNKLINEHIHCHNKGIEKWSLVITT